MTKSRLKWLFGVSRHQQSAAFEIGKHGILRATAGGAGQGEQPSL
jgi:hypothetical protein